MSEPNAEPNAEATTGRKKTKKSVIVLIVIAAVMLSLVTAAVITVNHFLNKINKIEDETPAVDPEHQNFDTDFDDDRTVEEVTRDMSGVDVNKNGFYIENGFIYYYENGWPTFAGLIQKDGAYYYVNGEGRVITNAAYYVAETNGLMAEGFYRFDENGRMLLDDDTFRDDQTLPIEPETKSEPATDDPATHNWVEDGAKSVPATCAASGIRAYVCTSCGQTKTETVPPTDNHEYAEIFVTDSENHWYDCTVCHARVNAAAHTPGPAATEDAPQVCTVCGYELAPKKEHTHVITAEWSFDTDAHWHACAGCDERLSYLNHRYDNACDETCNICGYTREITHKMADEWRSDTDAHWHTCTACGGILDKTAHSYDNACDTTCNVCGAVRIITHTPSAEWSADADRHFRVCAVCGITLGSYSHIYDNECDPVCNECGYTRQVTHTPSATVYDSEDEHWYTCRLCGEVLDRTPHTYTDACDADCNVCGHKRPITHTPLPEWSSDADAHWHACALCAAKADESAHVYDNACDTTCNVCGYVRAITHTPSADWKTGATYHRRECTVCGAELETYEHTPGPAATEYAPQTCTVCGYILVPKLDHVHRWSQTYASDGTGHWHACAGCAERTGFAVHVYDTSCDTACNVCGYVRTITHTPSAEWMSDGVRHWRECTVCHTALNVTSHVYSNDCDTSCNLCGYERTVTHRAETFWCSDAQAHRHICAVCGIELERAVHVYDNACDTACNVCGYVRTVTHSPSDVWVSDGNNHYRYCTVCGAAVGTASHVYDTGCDTACNVCGYVRTITHTPGAYAVADADSHTVLCAVCKTYIRTEAHIFDNTCDTTCNTCGFVRAVIHTVSETWRADAANHWHGCTGCTYRQDVAAHVYDNACDATCNICGYTRTVKHSTGSAWASDGTDHWHECTLCHKQTDKANHVYDNTCDTTCNVCGYTRTVTHVFKNVWSNSSTQHWRECVVCGCLAYIEKHIPNRAEATATESVTCTVCQRILAYATGKFYSNAEGHWSVGTGQAGSGDYGPHTFNAGGICVVCGRIDESDSGEAETYNPADLPEIPDSKELYNILLVGTDNSTSETGLGNSDSMMLCSINLKTGQIAVISFLRDLYVSIPGGYEDNRINAAYRFGGVSLLKQTITANFNITIDACVVVDFAGFENVIDVLGGVTVALTQREADALNARNTGFTYQPGHNIMTGKSALSYARLRSIDSDFGRTERQRKVINAMFNKLKNANLSSMIRIVNTVLPFISTDLTNGEIVALLTKVAPKLPSVKLNLYSVPNNSAASGEFHSAVIRKMMVLVPNLSVLKEKIFNQYLPYAR